LVRESWPRTELFTWLQQTAGIDEAEMCRTFNNGIGMVVVIAAEQADVCLQTLAASGEQVYKIGVIAEKGNEAAVLID
jgi:phosphoribosylformylglycinamidine cyclo-ligase